MLNELLDHMQMCNKVIRALERSHQAPKNIHAVTQTGFFFFS